MTDALRQDITERAAVLGSPIHTAVEDPDSVIECIPTPFLPNGEVVRVVTPPPEPPRLYVLGTWGKEGIAVLNNSPEAFFEMAAKGGLKLEQGADYVNYVVIFLESTRDFTGGIQILNSIEDSWWLRSPRADEDRKRKEVIAKYSAVVKAPSLSSESDSTVVVYLIRDRVLVRLDAKVESDGKVKSTETILEPKMPTVMLR
jgi:hypothetical protein